jgi:hypothetical protein
MQTQLILQARRIHYSDWDKIDSLIAKTSDPNTIEHLRLIQLQKYQREERL